MEPSRVKIEVDIVRRNPGIFILRKGVSIIENEIDLTIIYDYIDCPDKVSGRCDNCEKAHFKSSISKGKLIRECSNCGMKKSI